MKKENIKFYKILCVVFLIIISCMIIIDLSVFRKREVLKVQKVNNNWLQPAALKSYGYSETLIVLGKEPNIEAMSLNIDTSGKKLLKVDVKYNGNIEELQRTIDNLRKEDNFYNISNLRIENIDEKGQSISFELYLIKNK